MPRSELILLCLFTILANMERTVRANGGELGLTSMKYNPVTESIEVYTQIALPTPLNFIHVNFTRAE